MQFYEYFQQVERMGLPRWFRWVRLAQILLSLLILILTAVAAAKLAGRSVTYLTDLYPGFGFAWFAFSWTVVYLPLTIFVIPTLAMRFKPLIILMVLELTTTLWWLIAFALLADDSRKLNVITTGYSSRYYDHYQPAVDMTAASAAFGAAEFVMFAVCSAFIVMSFIRNHKQTSGNGPFVQVEEYPKERAGEPTAPQQV